MAARALHPLELAGRLVQEDLCVMQAAPEDAEDAGEYRLTAAALCFPLAGICVRRLGIRCPKSMTQYRAIGSRSMPQ